MGASILRGIRAALSVTVFALVIGMLWTAMGWRGLSMSLLVDIGLILSCVVAGFVSGKESGIWFLGGITGVCYVGLLVGSVALFLEISGWGAVQILGEGGLIGIVTGAVGSSGARSRESFYGGGLGSLKRNLTDYDSDDTHLDDWKDYDYVSDDEDESQDLKFTRTEKEKIIWAENNTYKEIDEWFDFDKEEKDKEENREDELLGDFSDELAMEHKENEPENKRVTTHKKAWWEEEVL